ncbi:PilC/PilY family type IV pilus protein [Desulfuromonas sp. AOP6]|uniref:pilus assembly protein n=1 Tax=Desulfuromonas sp. AOP6 TaxID=1566351 RepID=UPI001277A8DC|nr:PilC/PilY family type IV pilus protein [Desulfuromonas sp. AOP6]BCA80228.1 type IV pili system adhesin PilY [Desulfuromonas sp. AOP6]
MFRPINTIVTLLLLLLLAVCPLSAVAADTFLGDSAIYAYSPPADPDAEVAKPINLLFIIDNSSTMGNSAAGSPYALGLQDSTPDDGNLNYADLLPWADQDSTQFKIYPDPDDYDTDGDGTPDVTVPAATKSTWTVYKLTGQSNYVAHITASSYDDFLSKVTCEDAQHALLLGGRFSGSDGWELKNDGTCGKSSAGTTYLGNILNYNEAPPATGETTSQIDLVIGALKSAAEGVKNTIRIGIMEFGHNNKGGQVTFPVSDLSDDTNRAAFFTKLDELSNYVAMTPGNSRPLAESLFDARFYFDMERTSSYTPISNTYVPDSPIQNSCDKNFVILITNGESVGDSDPNMCKDLPAVGSYAGDYDGDDDAGDQCQANVSGNGTHMLDDIAKYAFDSDLSLTFEDKQNIRTHTLLVFTPTNPLLKDAAKDGHGLFAQAGSTNEVSAAIDNILNNIVAEVDTAFTAPVVPTSPENRTYSGSRVYLGFFKPISGTSWHGNLKKFGINALSEIVDQNGEVATCPDPNDTTLACDGIPSGGFKLNAQSYWSLNADAGDVEDGGVGEGLVERDLSTRMLYSNLTTETDLTHTSNRFNTTNVTAGMLDITSMDPTQDAADAVALVDYIYGYDTGDENGDGSTTDTRDWVMGDILHSKPLIVNYNSYIFTEDNEVDPAVNKTMIFVGSNDGMLHAFRDADGQEMWSFVPDNIIPELKELTSGSHPYYMDSSPVAYIYDKDGDGNIGPIAETMAGDLDPFGVTDNGLDDKVILVFGQRRGGNAYYALDVTDPLNPKFLWKFDNTTTDGSGNVLFPHLGQTWSEPQMHLMKIGTERKVVAFIGAGYDKEEDSRFGSTFNFPDPLDPLVGEGNVTSASDVNPNSPLTSRPDAKGRGVYAFEVATLNSSGVPTIPTAPTKIWGYTASNDSWLKVAIPSDITVLDSDFDGYADRLYVGDLGGRLWRFSVGSTDPANWTGRVIFWAGASEGRKIFYRPSVVQEPGYWMVAFGTGDRAHPLNTAVVDRLYMVKDMGQNTDATVVNYPTNGNLIDVTGNELQLETTTAADQQAILDSLNADTTFGWYIDLDRLNEENTHGGEKVLASPLIFNKVAYYTTYMPTAPSALSTDPCEVGNLGISRLYAVDYKTGEAVLNFYPYNDVDDPTSVSNTRALNEVDDVLRKEDRSLALGIGIPSGLVVVMPPSGDATLLIGCGGGLCSENPVSGGTIFQIYWKEW